MPDLVSTCVERWGLDLEPAMAGGACAYVAAAGSVVLKVGSPDEESKHESLALRAWDGRGAVHVVAEDVGLRAMLLERCRPGTPLLAVVRDRKEEVLAATRPIDRVRRRLDRFSGELGLDRERVRGWALAHTVAWGFEPAGAIPAHVEIARILLDA